MDCELARKRDEEMTKNALSNPVPYEQTPSETTPGIWQTFVGSIACVQHTMGQEVSPAWLMGVTGFAFRAIAQIGMTLSTTQWFHWETVCPEAIEQCGWQCIHFSHRGEDGSEEKRVEAHQQIVNAIDRGVPAIAWDIGDFEWGVLVGYDDERQSYDALACSNMVDWTTELSEYAELSGNFLKCLEVVIPGPSNGRSRSQIILNSLAAAVTHAEGGEWAASPKSPHWPSETVHGLAAFRCWAEAIERRAKAGERWADPLCLHIFSARFSARDYLHMIMGDDRDLCEAHAAYQTEVEVLSPVWHAALKRRQADKSEDEYQPPAGSVPEFVERIRQAGKAEASAVAALRRYVGRAG